MKLKLILLKTKIGICHFERNSSFPEWVTSADFYSVTKTPDELSVICSQSAIPAGVLGERNWRVFKVEGPLGFSLTGIVSALSTPLAKAKISILYLSTYETDYLFVEEKNLERSKAILSKFCEIKEE